MPKVEQSLFGNLDRSIFARQVHFWHDSTLSSAAGMRDELAWYCWSSSKTTQAVDWLNKFLRWSVLGTGCRHTTHFAIALKWGLFSYIYYSLFSKRKFREGGHETSIATPSSIWKWSHQICGYWVCIQGMTSPPPTIASHHWTKGRQVQVHFYPNTEACMLTLPLHLQCLII